VKKLLFILFSLLSFSAFATHERAGEITYICLGGLTYSITVTTYTKGQSSPADRCFLTIFFGDGDTAEVCRSNFMPGNPSTDPWGATNCGNGPCSTHHMGQWGYECSPFITMQSMDVKKNVYSIVHTYPGPGTYIISMTDPNRNQCIQNIPGSTNPGTPFSIQATLIINPFFLTGNNSPILANCPIDKACAGSCFEHNPGAVDPDGDSLSYKLGICFEDVGVPIPGYFIPAGVSVDPLTGDFTWCNPPPPSVSNNCDESCDEYNFAIDIEEWRKVGVNYYLIGAIRRDMQLTVCNCQNKPPIIANVNDTCILENTNLTFTVTAQDQGGNDIQSFTATGGPFSATPSATFTADVPPQKNLATGIFSWTPSCNQVRKFPYLVTLKATDDGAPDNVILSDYESFFITVIAPAPKNLTATPRCNSMDLKWDAATCNPSNNGLWGYRIYRKILPPTLACDTLIHTYCETGMPFGWNYSLIATVSYNQTSYTDIANLTPGTMYSYRVVAYYFDGAESYVSEPACNKLVRDVPIITNVSVVSTGANGIMDVKWLKPLANPTDYDTTIAVNHGPYKFDLLRATWYVNPTNIITSFSNPFFAVLDTTYFDSLLNTSASAYTYRVNFYDTIPANCPAKNASSVFLSCNPSDNIIQLTWQANVPWTNYQYDIYKFNSVISNWDLIGTTSLQTFTDTGLVNGANYCYKVKSIGEYADTTLPHPLINWSQELCCSPVDLIPPCPVTLAVDSSCALAQNLLTWNNPNNSCSDDALYYIIYHKPVENGDYSVLDTIQDINTTFFLHDSLSSIAGCYAVTSVDSFENESAYSNIVCVDNCPYYELPNVFTPNDDGSNDFFTPLHPYKYVKDIDIKIYNRWGTEVFRTNDPEIMWDGKSSQTKTNCSDGVYYYICIVNDIRLKGIIPRFLKGNVTLLRH